jgi:hypothetical protein
MASVAKYVHEAFNHREILLDTQSTLSDIISKIESHEEKSKRDELKSIRADEARTRKVSKEVERRNKAKESEWIKSLKLKFKEQANKYAILSREERKLEAKKRKEEEENKLKMKKQEEVHFDRKLSKLINMTQSLEEITRLQDYKFFSLANDLTLNKIK